jgi:alpha/beta superfamily hydrolase
VNAQTLRQLIAGPAGALECAIDAPAAARVGVAQTLARAMLALGWRSVRFNFRGVGASQGAWDEGRGEIDDALAVIAAHRAPGEALLLAGFSFGAYVASQAAARLPDDAKPQRLALVGPSTQKQQMPVVPADTVVIHGEADDVVPLSATLDWARPQALPVIVFPGVGHFFHGQLALLKNTLVKQLQPAAD